MAERELDALVVSSMPNVLYLTNFTGSTALAVVTADAIWFLTDSRYVDEVSATREMPDACPGLELVRVDGSYDASLATRLGMMSSAHVGFEAQHVSVERFDWWQRTLSKVAIGVTLTATRGLVERARARKDPYEIGVLREAATRLSRVATDVLGDVRRGRTERDLALAIDWRVRSAGFERSAFDTIVASGPNSGLPHARPGERRLDEGDLVVLDFGGVYASYCVDITRTVSIGPASARAKEVHAAVLEAHDRAVASVRSGQSRFVVDAAARDALGEAGLADAFGHGTGHGLGLEIHEDPRIARRHPDVDAGDEALDTGMVFTIEPGAYFPSWGGVRIEDDVVVTEGGVEVLTSATTELVEL
jgi:Xaa-Pro aminopeptidase